MLDLSNMQRLSIVSKGKLVCDSDWLDRIKYECQEIITRAQDKFFQNYTYESLDIFNHQSFDLLLINNSLAGWGGLYNGGRYPRGVFRIMNRLYLRPEFRSTSFYVPYFRKIVYPQQLQENIDEIKLLFLSRNDLKGRYHVNRWAKHGAAEEGWRVSKNMVQVAHCEKKGCYQYIAYKKFHEVEWNPKQITEKEWLGLPD